MDLGIAIRSIRKQLGISQSELAEKCEISQTALSQIENSVKRPSAKTIKKICVALDVPESIIYLLGMQQSDVSPAKKKVYDMLFPSIRSMALQIVGKEHRHLMGGFSDE